MKTEKEILAMMKELSDSAKEADIPMIISAEIDNGLYVGISGNKLQILGLASNIQVEITTMYVHKGLLND